MFMSIKKFITFLLAAAISISLPMSNCAAPLESIEASPAINYGNTSKPVDFDEKRVLTFSDSGKITIPGFIKSPKEIAVVVDTSKKYKINPFNYALFSDSDMGIQGSNIEVTGNVHANGSITAKQGILKVTGILESAKTISTSGNISATTVKYPVPKIILPKFSLLIKNDPEMERVVTLDHSETNYSITDNSLNSARELCTNGVYLGYNPEDNTFKITGSTVNLNTDKTVLYFNGNVTFTNGINFTGKKQYIIAEGNVTINGNCCVAKDTCIYSNGNIRIDPSNSSINGVIYAPDGKVTFSTTGNNVLGCVVAKEINNATNIFKVTYQNGDLIQNMGHYVDQYYFGKAKEYIEKLINTVKADGVKMSIISYSNSANEINGNSQNSFSLYDTNSEHGSLLNALANLNAGNDDKSNMGDGLRRAYYMLKNSTSDVQKYMIVLAFNDPNTWSAADNTKTSFLTGDGQANYFGNADNNKPVTYAKEIGNIIKSDSEAKIKTIFACYSTDGVLSTLNDIAKASGPDEITAGSGNYYYKSDPENLAYKLQSIPVILFSSARFYKASFTISLPKNVTTEAGEYQISWDGLRQSASKNISGIDLMLVSSDPSTGMQTYSFTATWNLAVQFLTPPGYNFGTYNGTVGFTGSDAIISYSIKYSDLSACSPSDITFKRTFNFSPDCVYTIEHIIDVN